MSEADGNLKDRNEAYTKAINEATKQKPYPSFLSLFKVSTIPELNKKLDELEQKTKKVSHDEIIKEGVGKIATYSDAFALRRDCHRRYASRYALLRKGYDSKLLQTTVLTGKYLIHVK